MLYFGVVENAIDPEDTGRVQVRVLPYYREFAVEDLPWAYVLRSTDLGNTFGRGLNQHNLIEGSQVLVEFLDPNMQQPIVLGIVPRESDFAEMQSYLTHTLKFLNGSEITVDETPDNEYIKITDTKKNYVLLNNDGITIHVGDSSRSIKLESANNINLEAKSDVNIEVGGDTNISTSGDTNISTSGDTNIESSGSVNIESSGSMNIESGGSLDIESSGSANIKSTGTTTVEGSKLTLRNITGLGQLCALPKCLFTGAPHQIPSSD